MPRRNEEQAGPEALRSATGRDHEGWREVLDAAGAREWSHAEIARWLVDEHGVDGWWAQGITVDFEQVRKGRRPGERADGTFATSRSRTLSGERLDALRSVADVIRAELGEPHGESLEASQPNVRWRLDDGTRIAVAAGVPNRSGTPVTVTIERLQDEQAVEPARARITAFLDAASAT